jgi:hypothetical protein
MRRPIHRIRAAHGCEYLRYASGPSNKECALRASPGQGPLAASAETPDKAEKLMLFAAPDRDRWADIDSPVMSIERSSDCRPTAAVRK